MIQHQELPTAPLGSAFMALLRSVRAIKRIIEIINDVPMEARALIRQSAIMARAAKDAKLKKRRLTNLYNERPTWLRIAHEQLDRAVLAAYAATDPEGEWSEDWAQVWVDTGAGFPLPPGHELTQLRKETDQRVLASLLQLNLERGDARKEK